MMTREVIVDGSIFLEIVDEQDENRGPDSDRNRKPDPRVVDMVPDAYEQD